MGNCRDSAPLSLTDKLRPKSGVSQKTTPTGLFLLDVTTGLCCELNALGARVFSHVADGGSLLSLYEQLLAEYDVAPEVLEHDLEKLGAELIARGMLERG